MRSEVSTRFTFMYRWVIPGMLTVAAIAVILYFSLPDEGGTRGAPDIAIGAVIAGLLIILARYYDRAKRVWIDGDNLVIYDFNQTAEVPLSDIGSVTQLFLYGPERITVRFRKPTVFGSQISFFPPLRWPFPRRHPAVAVLNSLITS